VDITWARLVSKFKSPKLTPETLAEYAAMTKDERAAVKSSAGYVVGGRFQGNVRRNENIELRELINLDLDNVPANMMQVVAEKLKGYEFFFHQTHSHGLDGKSYYRVLLPPSRAMTAEESCAVTRILASKVGMKFVDPVSFKPAQVMYMPSISKDSSYECGNVNGAWVDVDGVLGELEDWHDVSQWPTHVGEDPLRHARKMADPGGKRGIVGTFCRCFNVMEAIDEFLPGVYTETTSPGGQPRYSYAGGSTANGAVVYDDGAFLHSHHSTDPVGGRSVNAFDLVRLHKFGDLDSEKAGDIDTPITKMPSYKAMCEWVCAQPWYRIAKVEEIKDDFDTMPDDEDAQPYKSYTPAMRSIDEDDDDFDLIGDATGPTATRSKVSGAGASADAAAVDRAAVKVYAGDDYDDDDEVGNGRPLGVPKRKIACKAADVDITDKGELKPTVRTAFTLIETLLPETIWYNDLDNRVEMRHTVPWPKEPGHGGAAQGWVDDDTTQLARMLARQKGVIFSPLVLDAAVRGIASERRYSPVVEYLESLPAWDGVSRVSSIFPHYLGAEDSAYIRAVGTKFVCNAVRRALRPGCKVDSMPVLVGPQGIGKSTFGAILFGLAWFHDDVGDITNKSAIENIEGKWCIEMPEMSVFKRAEIEHQKAFMSRTVDRGRRAYARTVTESPRRCVFIGSTNDEDFLTDVTGNRRYWPVKCHKSLNWAELRAARDMIWAEALTLWKTEKPHMDTAELESESRQVASGHTETDPWSEAIQKWLSVEQYDMEDLEAVDRFGSTYRAGAGEERKVDKMVETDADFTEMDCVARCLRTRVTPKELLTEALGLTGMQLTAVSQKRVGGILKQLGWVRRENPVRTTYGRVRVWMLEEDLI